MLVEVLGNQRAAGAKPPFPHENGLVAFEGVNSYSGRWGIRFGRSKAFPRAVEEAKGVEAAPMGCGRAKGMAEGTDFDRTRLEVSIN